MEGLKHCCKGWEQRALMNPSVSIFLEFAGLGPVMITGTTPLGSHSCYSGVIHIIFCPFCGANLKEQLASQNPPASEAKAGNGAAK